ncbi:DUF4433 domain-containing protein [Neolewinella xylanilytica]|nr:DUF4433 domain-containing protein [Neolewinella xylanilytica]
MKLDEVHLYRMVHVSNIRHILQHGITHVDSPNKNTNYVPIGDRSLINKRTSITIAVDNGQGYNDDHNEIVLGDYIPFYFGIKMPMLFVMQNGGNFVDKTPPEDIIYLVLRLNKVLEVCPEFYFTDGHGTDRLTTFYDWTMRDHLPDIVDWQSVKAGYWAGNENLDLKRKKQAEFLAKPDIPPDCIRGFICYAESTKDKLLSLGIADKRVKIIKKCYY